MARALSEEELLSLIDALADGDWHSGEQLATDFGISRAALAKRVAHLSDWGITPETRAGVGYRLAAPLERLSVARIRDGLSSDRQERLATLTVIPCVDSTNQRLMEADPAKDPQVLFAEMQTAGRGRRGREWRSPFAANLYMSLAWSFPRWPVQLGTLSLAIGVTCARLLHDLGIRNTRLKWPNDLRIGSSKVGGILIEQRGEAGGSCRVVIGIGLNVNMTAGQAPELDQLWTSLTAASRAENIALPSRSVLAGMLLRALIDTLITFDLSGFRTFSVDWSRFDAAAGQSVSVTGLGSDVVHGIARGIDSEGALLVESGGKRLHVHAGEVSLRIEAGSAL